MTALAGARADLQRLSQPALDTLSELLGLWLLECRDDRDASCNFGDPSDLGPSLPLQNVENRVMRGGRGSFDRAMDELRSRDLVDIWVDEDAGTVEYTLGALWRLGGRLRYNFWRSAAEFLYEGYGVGIQDWIKGLDFSIFDRAAPTDRVVPWR